MTAASNEKGSAARIRSGAPSTFFKHPCQIWTVRSHARSRKIRLSFEIAIKSDYIGVFVESRTGEARSTRRARKPLLVRGGLGIITWACWLAASRVP
jgi:hypothetical protein